jgi:hypothetical protein
MTITASLMIYWQHLRLIGELEDERRENRLSALRASYSNARRSDAYSCTRLYWQIDLDVIYKVELQTAMIRCGRGVKEAVIKQRESYACIARTGHSSMAMIL